MTEIKECKESQEVIDFVVLKRAESSKNTNRVISWLLNDKGYKRYNGKEFKERDISTILLSQGVRRKSEYTKKKDNEEVTESSSGYIASGDISKGDRVYLDTDNTVKSINQDFKIGDKVRVITKRLKEFDKVGKVVSIHHKFKDLVNVEFEGCKPDLYCTIHLELVKEEKQETEFKKADDKFKVGDKVRVSNEYCLEYDFIGVVIDFTSDVFLNYAQVKFDNINKIFKYNQDNLELVEEVTSEPVKEVEKVNSFKVGDWIKINNSNSHYYNRVGKVLDIDKSGALEILELEFKYEDNSVFQFSMDAEKLSKEDVNIIEDNLNIYGKVLAENKDTFNFEAKEIVYKKDNKLFTDSLHVASVFDREHKNVLKSIENLECSPEFRSANFLADLYTDSFNRTQPKIEMTEKGFSLLAFSFSGSKATKFREKYLDKFEEMREQLTQTKPITAIDLFSSQVDAFKYQQSQIDEIKQQVTGVVNKLELQEIERQKSLDELKAVEYSTNPSIETPIEKKILAVVNKYVLTTFEAPGESEFKETWYRLDKEIFDKLGKNITIRKHNYKMKGIDRSRLQIMYELDILNQVFDIVSDIFKV